MKKALRIVLWVLIGLIALNFLVTGLRWAVDPSGAAEAFDMSLFSGAALSTQIGDIGAFFIGMGLFVLLGLVTRKREWFLACATLVFAAALFRTLAWLFHGASLMMQFIVPEIIIGTLLLIASKKLTAENSQVPAQKPE
ncbi:hypothetical protein [Sphingorhabdus sp. Alg239-R122]|uniref:hypothetical protein n=1 Tax=Sphingorhabdus sp. Alg239-R122 TaxID=2305989 RepID=UPI0013DB45B7|nr:hypothetical protein [Sphingorhabdus sp. Alg239-R122]